MLLSGSIILLCGPAPKFNTLLTVLNMFFFLGGGGISFFEAGLLKLVDRSLTETGNPDSHVVH